MNKRMYEFGKTRYSTQHCAVSHRSVRTTWTRGFTANSQAMITHVSVLFSCYTFVTSRNIRTLITWLPGNWQYVIHSTAQPHHRHCHYWVRNARREVHSAVLLLAFDSAVCRAVLTFRRIAMPSSSGSSRLKRTCTESPWRWTTRNVAANYSPTDTA